MDATDIFSYEAATPKSEVDEYPYTPNWGVKKDQMVRRNIGLDLKFI